VLDLLYGDEDIAFEDAAVFAGPADGAGVDVVLFDEFADCGREGLGMVGGHGGGVGEDDWFGSGIFRGTTSGGGFGGLVDGGDDLADFDFVVGLGLEGDDASGFCWGFRGNFVGLQFVEEVALVDVVAILYEPVGQDAGGDGFPHGGDFDFGCHGVFADFGLGKVWWILGEGDFKEVALFQAMEGEGAGGRACCGGTAYVFWGAAEFVDNDGCHKEPAAHVFGFFLYPVDAGIGILAADALEEGYVHGVELLDAEDGGVIDAFFFAFFEEVVVDPARAEDEFLGFSGEWGRRGFPQNGRG
jgi:hypothetical protein